MAFHSCLQHALKIQPWGTHTVFTDLCKMVWWITVWTNMDDTNCPWRFECLHALPLIKKKNNTQEGWFIGHLTLIVPQDVEYLADQAMICCWKTTVPWTVSKREGFSRWDIVSFFNNAAVAVCMCDGSWRAVVKDCQPGCLLYKHSEQNQY